MEDIGGLLSDLAKGSMDGFRKLDVNLLHNMEEYDSSMSQADKLALWNTPDKQLYYDQITIYFKDGTRVDKDFVIAGIPVLIHTHQELYEQLVDWPEFMTKVQHTKFAVFSDGELGDWGVLRFYDSPVRFSTVERVDLKVSNATYDPNYDPALVSAKSWTPVYTWVNSTSVMQLIGAKIPDVVHISDNIETLSLLSQYLQSLLDIYDVLDKLASLDPEVETIHKRLPELTSLIPHLNELTELADNINESVEGLEEEMVLKANKMTHKVVVKYHLSSSLPDPNTSTGFTVGDVAQSGSLSVTVNSVDGTGMVVGYTLSPQQVDNPVDGTYTFIGGTGTGLRLIITSAAVNVTIPVNMDLTDVYVELKTLIDSK